MSGLVSGLELGLGLGLGTMPALSGIGVWPSIFSISSCVTCSKGGWGNARGGSGKGNGYWVVANRVSCHCRLRRNLHILNSNYNPSPVTVDEGVPGIARWDFALCVLLPALPSSAASRFSRATIAERRALG